MKYQRVMSHGESEMGSGSSDHVDIQRKRFPHCLVWTPIPCLSWFIPFIGHMGIATSDGVIRDFAGPYFVSEDDMAFGWPTRYWQLDLRKVVGGPNAWDKAVAEASEIYVGRMHNLCCDNCHSHCATALDIMKYDGKTSWNMIKLCFGMIIFGKYTSIGGWIKQWLPFIIFISVILVVVLAPAYLMV